MGEKYEPFNMIVTIIVHDRFENLERWVTCMKDSPYPLVVIHNDNGDKKFAQYCRENNVMYFRRDNIGFDIGSFQDVCNDKIEGFPDWDKMLWSTDDTIPVKKDFVEQFLSKFNGHSTPCMEISREVTPHIRTTGFLIDKQTAKRLVFPANPITTKDQCYHFEHRGGRQTFFHQLNRMGKRPVMVSALQNSPLWDIGNKRHLRMNRWSEFEQNFNGKIISDKVTVICPIFNTYPEIIGSMICQTHKNWELLLIHDGKNETGLRKIVDAVGDKRITYIETKERRGNWGHSYRKEYLEGLREAETGYVLITNGDNQYAPVFFEYMLKNMHNNHNVVATYCSDMVHSYKAWQVIPCSLRRGYLDSGGVLIRKDVACDVGWNNTVEHSADWLYFDEIIKKYGAHRFLKVTGCLFSHH
jgi:hypothetical protein